MNKIKFYFIVLMAAFTINSCNDKNDDDIEITPPRDFSEQYKTDIATIENYLKTHYFTVLSHPGFPDDQDVTISKIDANQTAIWAYLDSSTLPRLTSRKVTIGAVEYEVYTLVIREGIKGGINLSNQSGGEYPCNVDAVFAGYKGTLMDEAGTVFDSSNNGQVQYNLDGQSYGGGIGVIRGWAEAFPEFKTGWVSSNDNGTIRYNDFGVGVMFLPSALGYYNQAQGSIPAYSPLVFSVKLYALKRLDHDADGVPSYLEDVGVGKFHDRYMYYLAPGVSNPDDTDGDGIPDYGDFDDDGDGYATRGEVKDKNGNYYEFDKIPDCSGNTTDPNRLKRHLDKNCIKMSQ